MEPLGDETVEYADLLHEVCDGVVKMEGVCRGRLVVGKVRGLRLLLGHVHPTEAWERARGHSLLLHEVCDCVVRMCSGRWVVGRTKGPRLLLVHVHPTDVCERGRRS